MTSHRIERVNHLIRQEICELLQREIKDPRLDNFVTVTQVDTAQDLRHARVYVSSFAVDVKREQTLIALSSAAGFMRNEMSKHLRLKHIPELDFYWDNRIEEGARVLELIDKVFPQKSENKPQK